MENDFSFVQLATKAERLPSLAQVIAKAFHDDPKPIVLFGSGCIGGFYLDYLQKMEIVKDIYFCDNDSSKCGKTIDGVLVISFEELKREYSDSYIIISTTKYFDEINFKLKENHLETTWLSGADFQSIFDIPVEGFSDYSATVKNNLKQFESAYLLMSDERSKQIFRERISYCATRNPRYLIPYRSWTPQYFAPDIIKLSDQEVFIDGGAFTGDTVEEFIKQTDGKFKKVFSFEPEKIKHEEFFNITVGYKNIELLPYGLWNKCEVLRFSALNDGRSGLNQSGGIEISVTSIDETLNGDPVTFIKMDIEGAEVEALKGAEESIRKYKPKLAICVYHKPLDLVEIPIYLKKLVPEYKFYLRHYGDSFSETVLYAVTE